MDFQLYIIIVAVAAIIYAGIARFLQNKLVDRSKMEKLQAESKRLNAEYKEASERKDKTRMDKVMKEQMELFPQMNKIMFAQFKPMIIIIGVFFVFTTVVNHVNPYMEDDLLITVFDDGEGCDKVAGDGVFQACVELDENQNYGKWTAVARALKEGGELGKNETYFLYNTKSHEEIYIENPTGAPVGMSTDKETYYPGETVIISVTPPAEAYEVELRVSNGTFFHVDLPFTIPLLNVKTIYQAQWWFIFVSILSSLSISFILGRMRKKK